MSDDGANDNADGDKSEIFGASHCSIFIAARLSMEHGDIAGLIALTGRDEAAHLFARLFLRFGAAGDLERLGAALRREQRRHIGELLALQREELIAGLRRLQRADGGLAG